MRTFLFKEYLDSENGRFFPVETYNSEEFGRTFMIDDNLEFLSAPLLKSGKYDEGQVGYVSEWTDFEGVDMSKLMDINRKLCWNQWQEDREKAHNEFCEYMEAVECGEIEYL